MTYNVSYFFTIRNNYVSLLIEVNYFSGFVEIKSSGFFLLSYLLLDERNIDDCVITTFKHCC